MLISSPTRQRVVRRVTTILAAAVSLALSACGGSTPDAGGASSPGSAVEAFAAAAGNPSQANLGKACGQISPSVRPAMRFQATLKPDDRNCIAALSLALYYPGDTGDVPATKGFTAEAGDVVEQGNRAFVSVNMTYEGVPSGSRAVEVLTVREAGQWWVATPSAFSIRNTLKPLGRPALLAEHQEFLTAAREAEAQTKAGEDATSTLGNDAAACPRDGASVARDARGDVQLADGGTVVTDQRPSEDLVEVTHNTDGDNACFALRFAGDVPPKGGVRIAIRPQRGQPVTVRWEPGQVLGQRGGANDTPTAVKVDATRDGPIMVIRLPRRALTITSPTYRWAVTAFVVSGHAQVGHLDNVPDDQTITGEQDHYIRHGG